jgi:anti-sigma regulatory factor (Ser/Thr protein kinase)
MEHGNHYQPDLKVEIVVKASPEILSVTICDHGGGKELIESEEPDLDAKLAGMQSPRGWGLFLIKKMVDEMNVSSDQQHHTVELILHLTGEKHD